MSSGSSTTASSSSVLMPLEPAPSEPALPEGYVQLGRLRPGELRAPQPALIPVYAIHLGGEVDYASFAAEHAFKSRVFARDHVLLEVEEMSEDKVLLGAGREEAPEQRLMLIYRYGSVIFFNMRAKSRDKWLADMQPYLKRPSPLAGSEAGSSSSSTPAGSTRSLAEPAIAAGGLRQDETHVVVRPDLSTWSALEPDKIVVASLDLGNVRVISHVLGQSVALDYFNAKVDEAIQQFNPYLLEVARTGQCTNVKEARLLQLIADNSLLYTDVVTKIGLLDISQTAWTQDRYHGLWHALRVDYEIDRRFDAINRKLGPMLENAKFLLDIRAEKKSVEAEWIIILLILLEVVVNCYGHFVL